jgi:hypothetical protein
MSKRRAPARETIGPAAADLPVSIRMMAAQVAGIMLAITNGGDDPLRPAADVVATYMLEPGRSAALAKIDEMRGDADPRATAASLAAELAERVAAYLNGDESIATGPTVGVSA